MDRVRQWWYDAAWPNMKKLRWFIAAWVVLVMVAVPWSVRGQERSLEDASRDALAASGVVVEDVAFTGRNAVVVAALTPADQARAEAALADIEGIGNVEWRVTTPPVTTTTTTVPPTTTTTLPEGDAAALELKVQSGRIVLRGTLPDAKSIAAIGSSAEMLYGPGSGNGAVVGDVWSPPWVPVAADVVALLPMLGDAEVILDGTSAYVVGVAATEAAAESFRSAFEDLLGPDVSVSVDLAVAAGDLPEVTVAASADGVVSVSGTVARKKLLEEIVAAATALTDGGEIVNELSVSKSRAEVHVANRIPMLIARMGVAAEWSLVYEDGELVGTWVGEGSFRGKQPDGSVRLDNLLDEIGALLVGNPDLVIEVEVSTAIFDTVEANVELARRRGFATLNALVRRGVDPERITNAVGDAEGEVLRFVVANAER